MTGVGNCKPNATWQESRQLVLVSNLGVNKLMKHWLKMQKSMQKLPFFYCRAPSIHAKSIDQVKSLECVVVGYFFMFSLKPKNILPKSRINHNPYWVKWDFKCKCENNDLTKKVELLHVPINLFNIECCISYLPTSIKHLPFLTHLILIWDVWEDVWDTHEDQNLSNFTLIELKYVIM